MKHITKMILVCLAVIFTLGFSGSKVFGDGGGITGAPTDEPPKGLAISSDASGQKLVGELFTEHWNYHPVPGIGGVAEVFRAAIRLRSGKVLETYFLDMDCNDMVEGQCPSTDPTDPNCLLKPICQNFDCFLVSEQQCYDASSIPRVQQSLMIWWASQDDFCEFLGKLNTKCGEITLKSFKEYAPVLATDPAGVPTKIHLSDIEIAVK